MPWHFAEQVACVRWARRERMFCTRAPRLASVRPPGRGGRGQGGGGGLGRPDGAGPGKWLGFSLFFLNFCSVFFYLIFCHCFEFKIIQKMPKVPLNIFILLDVLFSKSS